MDMRDMAIEQGFGLTDQTRLVTAASELARNIVLYAGTGEMALSVIFRESRKGIKLVFEDNGPGLDVDEVLTPGFSTGKGLGMGLPGSKRLMDEFELQSEKDKGTTVTIIKWLRETTV
jgi:serine/threonine-protein kinase RsbT